MRKNVAVGLGIIVVLISSCTQYRLTRRFKTAAWRETVDDWVKAAAFTLNLKPQPTDETIFRLSPAAQAAFIKAIGEKSGNAYTFLQALGSDFQKKSEDSPVFYRTLFHCRVVVSVEKSSFFNEEQNMRESLMPGPADRISELLIKLSGLENGCFISWNRFETQYETINIGSLSLKESNQAELGVGGTALMKKWLGQDVLSVEGSLDPRLGYGRELKEELSLRQRYVGFSGRLSPKGADIFMQGVSGIDLAGNFAMDLKIEVPSSPRRMKVFLPGITQTEESPLSPEKMTWKTASVVLPASTEDVTCNLSCRYTIRHVLKNSDTIVEGDDHVLFVQGRLDGLDPVVLVRTEELKTRLFYLAAHKDALTGEITAAGEKVYLRPLFEGPVYFADYETASRFLSWLKAVQAIQVAGCPLRFNRRPLTKDDLGFLVVEGMNFVP
ncbi:MAG: hypothetical protein JXB26_06865 [Candidatus Aminicenantes bacterium]|nr:hypothetical protein [Candidatus Aminicenantes bacterium]